MLLDDGPPIGKEQKALSAMGDVVQKGLLPQVHSHNGCTQTTCIDKGKV